MVCLAALQTKAMSSYGYSIVQALVTDILPDQKVRNAMNEINAASRLRCAGIRSRRILSRSASNAFQALSRLLQSPAEQLPGYLHYRVAAVEKGEAHKITVVKAAEADAEAKFLQGQVRLLSLFCEHLCETLLCEKSAMRAHSECCRARYQASLQASIF